jgi:release factor glutamine methyltransferase
MGKHQEESSHPPDIKGALIRARKDLVAAGVESPRLTTELLLGHVLGWERSRILSHSEERLSAEALGRFSSLIRRRAAGEPLQYITGTQEFFGLPFRVTPDVLIPRPETEILVEKALQLARESVVAPARFADVGTGSGCIGVSFAAGLPRAIGFAIDLSWEALAVARDNAERNGVRKRLHFVQGDLLDCLFPRPAFELILSNPPYVSRKDQEILPVTVRHHEPSMALFAGDAGTEIYERLIPQAAARLVDGGHLLMEVGSGLADDVARLVVAAGLSVESIEKDLQSIPRCIVARRGHG